MEQSQDEWAQSNPYMRALVTLIGDERTKRTFP